MVVPNCVQVVPLEDTKPVIVFPDLTSRTQLLGGALMGRGPWYEVVPSIIVRETMPKPFPVVAGVVKTVEWREPAVRVSRIMMPALAQSFVFVWPVTRARISPSPVIRVWAKWKPSALKKMSSPEAVMVYHGLG